MDCWARGTIGEGWDDDDSGGELGGDLGENGDNETVANEEIFGRKVLGGDVGVTGLDLVSWVKGVVLAVGGGVVGGAVCVWGGLSAWEVDGLVVERVDEFASIELLFRDVFKLLDEAVEDETFFFVSEYLFLEALSFFFNSLHFDWKLRIFRFNSF